MLQVLDRLKLAELVQGLEEVQLPRGVRARPPKFHLVQDFSRLDTSALQRTGDASGGKDMCGIGQRSDTV